MKHYQKPNPDEIKVNRTDLGLMLRDFRNAIRSARVTFRDLLVLVPAWIFPFTVDFQNYKVLGQSFGGGALKGAYFGFVLVGSIFWLEGPLRKTYCWVFKKNKDKDRLYRNETDPEQKVKGLFDRSNVIGETSDEGTPNSLYSRKDSDKE